MLVAPERGEHAYLLIQRLFSEDQTLYQMSLPVNTRLNLIDQDNDQRGSNNSPIQARYNEQVMYMGNLSIE